MLFLQELTAFGDQALSGSDATTMAFLLAFIGAFLLVFAIIFIAIYIYTSFAYMAIARKANYHAPGLAWIPGVGPLIIAFSLSGMHWWPWLLLIGFWIPIVSIIAIIVFTVYNVIWHWKMFEVIGKPGWWAILQLIPIVGLVMLGIAAWSKK